jgi:hypothetical protein
MIHPRQFPARAWRALRSLAFVLALVPLTPPLARATDLPVRGGAGGGDFKSDCGEDYVVGVYLKSGGWVDSIGLKCAGFDAAQGKFKQPPWNKPFHGGQGGGPQEGVCPAGSYAGGLKFGFTRDGGNPKYLDYVEIICNRVENGNVTQRICLGSGNGCWDQHPDPPPNCPPFAGCYVYFLSFDESCAAGEAMTGIHGRYGSYVDALGVTCGPKPVADVAGPPDIIVRPPGLPGDIISAPKPQPQTPPPPPPPPPQVTVLLDVDVYNAPDGAGQKIALLRAGTPGVTLVEPCRNNWCHVNWPAGQGWAYSGPDYRSLKVP